MSDEKQPETDAEYLTQRGWNGIDDEDGGAWLDPMHVGSEGDQESYFISTTSALTVQTARDEQEERAAWVRFANARLVFGVGKPGGGRKSDESSAATSADHMLVEYRARFARKVAP